MLDDREKEPINRRDLFAIIWCLWCILICILFIKGTLSSYRVLVFLILYGMMIGILGIERKKFHTSMRQMVKTYCEFFLWGNLIYIGLIILDSYAENGGISRFFS